MTVEIPLSQGLAALVDDADAAMVIALGPWSAFRRNRTFYARRTVRSAGRETSLYMHRVLLDSPRVDHANGNGLDNRRSNLRSASHAENMRNARRRTDNTSGFKGVSWAKRRGRWTAAIHVDCRRIHLGSFDDSASAARAYDVAAIQHFGKFAALNFPNGSTSVELAPTGEPA